MVETLAMVELEETAETAVPVEPNGMVMAVAVPAQMVIQGNPAIDFRN